MKTLFTAFTVVLLSSPACFAESHDFMIPGRNNFDLSQDSEMGATLKFLVSGQREQMGRIYCSKHSDQANMRISVTDGVKNLIPSTSVPDGVQVSDAKDEAAGKDLSYSSQAECEQRVKELAKILGGTSNAMLFVKIEEVEHGAALQLLLNDQGDVDPAEYRILKRLNGR